MEAVKEPRNWTPKRRGSVYCSPACGGGCTWAAYQNAQAQAKTMAKRLGKGWKPVVHENLGWHYHAVLETSAPGWHGPMALKVYQSITGNETTYWTMFGSIGGETQWDVREQSKTPEEAVEKQLGAVHNYVEWRDKQRLALAEAILRAEKGKR